MTTRATELAAALANLAAPVFDPATVGKAKLCLLDFLGCAFEASELEPSRQAAAAVPAAPGGHMIGESATATPADAAFVNAVKGHGLVREDMHAASVSHHGVVVWPLLLALAETNTVHGMDLLRSAVVAYEVGGRLGRMLIDPTVSALFRPTGLVAPIGSACGGAWMLKLDQQQMAATIALAANTASGLNQWPQSGGSDMFFHPGFAARNAWMAVRLAQSGAFGSPDILEGRSGYFAALARRPMPGRIELFPDGEADILNVYHKAAPACNFAQTACQTALKVVEMIGSDAAPVERIRISVPAAAASYPGCDRTGPFDRTLQAKMSIPFGVAAVFAHGRLSEDIYRYLDDPETMRLIAVSELVASPDLTALFPGQQGAAIDVVLGDGRKLSMGLPDVVPATEAQVRERFRKAAADIVGVAGAEAIEEFVDRLDTRKDAGRLLSLCAVGGPARRQPTRAAARGAGKRTRAPSTQAM
ncbi:MmgE/PrpD family protein [Mesorhizobium sp. ES1-1]|uniref:MmgE/PrpD family protein n=1 Tax=Mesorhizobium sp. ES1-1 TaxID=2876629 RepID=UPI001CCDD0A1|nr:MmgE/PrpD family protein [Mesorhizobium sp. ES1-1]MBZ9674296.1 MmgE/PrpD family protein [Mesorhizobium sp. ES1-1]